MSNEEIFQTMKDLVSEQFGMELDEVTLETSFEDDLGADSVDLVESVSYTHLTLPTKLEV